MAFNKHTKPRKQETTKNPNGFLFRDFVVFVPVRVCETRSSAVSFEARCAVFTFC